MNKQKEYWNGVANEKEFTTPFQFDLFSEYVNKDAILLDYGYGYGRTLLELREKQFTNLYGVSFSEEMIKTAKSNGMAIAFNIIKSEKHISHIFL